jgi:hypothetical protein
MKYLTLISFVSVVLSACSNEMPDWKNAVSSNTIQNYELFVRNYPKSKYADSANFKIEELSYRNAWLSDSLINLELFLNKYPKSKFIDSANNKIFELKNTEQGKLVGINTSFSLNDAAKGTIKDMYYEGKIIIEKSNGERREALCDLSLINKLKGGQTLKVIYDRKIKDWKVVAIIEKP